MPSWTEQAPGRSSPGQRATANGRRRLEWVSRGRVWLAVCAMVAGLAIGGGMVALSAQTALSGGTWSDLAQRLPGAHEAGSRTIGSPDARVQILVYFDFQCSHCEALHRQVEGELVRRYVATGKARLEARPLMILGADSARAAEAALCAADAGRFWEYRDALFAAWVRDGRYAYSDESLVKVAGRIGLNEAEFSARLSSGQHRAEVEAMAAQAEEQGVTSVPITFINGQRIAGDQPLDVFVKTIEEELAR